jgi:hypothetical protein
MLISTPNAEVPAIALVSVVLLWLSWFLAVGLLLLQPYSQAGLLEFLAANAAAIAALLVLAAVAVGFTFRRAWARVAVLAILGLVVLSWFAAAVTGYNILFGYGRLVRTAAAFATLAVVLTFYGPGAAWFSERGNGAA